MVNFGGTIEEMVVIHKFLDGNSKLLLFKDLACAMNLPHELISTFEDAFDEEGELNADKYPTLREFKKEIASLRTNIGRIMQSILQDPKMKEKLSDDGYMEIDGRFCIMLKNTYKKGVGIVHGSSNTGRSLYVEPTDVIEPTNQLKSIIARMKVEENNILSDMCRNVARNRKEIEEAANAIARVDTYRAKALLGQKLGGTIPEVYDDGHMRCIDAKHPILVLRGIDTIGNDIELDDKSSCLVISGPNAGGKTIVLKTAGLFVLMVKYGIPIPAKRGSRVDIFQVMADIGDIQTVSGDLSTFSGHLMVCREMIFEAERCFRSKQASLVLLDEIGTGTDPAQGAALAQAVLEDLLGSGSKVIVTTHYQRIKDIAAENKQIQIAAMEFVKNKPTYRLKVGFVGESYALEAGRRMQLPERVLARADGLLDNESRRLLALQKKLEEETEKARLRQKELDRMIDITKKKDNEIVEVKASLQNEIKRVRIIYTSM